MTVYLVQHAQSLPKDQDPGRGLSDAGRAAARRIAEVAAGYGVRPHRVFHSGKLRARQTAGIFAQRLASGLAPEEMEGLGPLDDVRPVAEALDTGGGWMLVGHLPFMERLCGLLAAGDADRRVFKFQNAGIVCLDREAEGPWFIRWALMPEIR